MDNIYSKLIAERTSLSRANVQSVINLLNSGATVPFIARYRKDQTGAMEDVHVFEVQKLNKELSDLSDRKKHILGVAEGEGKLTLELEKKIDQCWDKKMLEDIYLPFKPKRKTKAEAARANGLEVLAKIIMKQEGNDLSSHVSRFVKGDVKTAEDAIQGAKDIIAEWMSEHLSAKNSLRRFFKRNAKFVSKVKKGKEREGEKYELYFDFEQALLKVPSHRFLAVTRGVEEGVLASSIAVDKKLALAEVNRFFVKSTGRYSQLVEEALSDAYSRLLKPSVENELIKEVKEKSDNEAIKVFSKNLKQLLMVPPTPSKRILAIDPGFKTGCKVVCLDEQGNLLHNETIFPHPPQKKFKESITKISTLVNAYKINAIAVGNGTAGRETEGLIQKVNFTQPMEVFMVNENGASIYSASPIGRAEFPNHDVTVRGAVSIGRRLMDPLAELVKIDPKSIGVGQYQHDVDQVKLKLELDHVVESCVNQVGVNVNTASKYLLQYVAGVGPSVADHIIKYRDEVGTISNRLELKKVPRLGDKVYEQCAGFLKVSGENPLDETSVHPEHYSIVRKIEKKTGKTVRQLAGDESILDLDFPDLKESIGEFTLKDILTELVKPGFDPRKKIRKFNFDPNLKTIEDVKEGMIVPGLVTNLTNFGAFVDIGIKENGLVHISHITDRFISSPMEALDLNDYVRVKIISVDVAKKRVGLSIKEAKD